MTPGSAQYSRLCGAQGVGAPQRAEHPVLACHVVGAAWNVTEGRATQHAGPAIDAQQEVEVAQSAGELPGCRAQVDVQAPRVEVGAQARPVEHGGLALGPQLQPWVVADGVDVGAPLGLLQEQRRGRSGQGKHHERHGRAEQRAAANHDGEAREHRQEDPDDDDLLGKAGALQRHLRLESNGWRGVTARLPSGGAQRRTRRRFALVRLSDTRTIR